MTPSLTLTRSIADEDRETIRAALLAHNDGMLGKSDRGDVFIPLKGEDGKTEGGLVGTIARGWLYIDYLFVPERLRGQGVAGKMLQMAEDEARARGCIGVYLDTLNPKALRAYQRQGYKVFGSLGGFSGGWTVTWLKKTF